MTEPNVSTKFTSASFQGDCPGVATPEIPTQGPSPLWLAVILGQSPSWTASTYSSTLLRAIGCGNGAFQLSTLRVVAPSEIMLGCRQRFLTRTALLRRSTRPQVSWAKGDVDKARISLDSGRRLACKRSRPEPAREG